MWRYSLEATGRHTHNSVGVVEDTGHLATVLASCVDPEVNYDLQFSGENGDAAAHIHLGYALLRLYPEKSTDVYHRRPLVAVQTPSDLFFIASGQHTHFEMDDVISKAECVAAIRELFFNDMSVDLRDWRRDASYES